MKRKICAIILPYVLFASNLFAFADDVDSFCAKEPFKYMDLDWGISLHDVTDKIDDLDLYSIANTVIGDEYWVPDIRGAILDYPGMHHFVFENDHLIEGYTTVDTDHDKMADYFSDYENIFGYCVDKYGIPQSESILPDCIPHNENEFAELLSSYKLHIYWYAEDSSMLEYSAVQYSVSDPVKFSLHYYAPKDINVEVDVSE